jgi:Family of unknown function (DUF5719)
MSENRPFRWAATSARLLAGTIVLIIFVVGVVTAVSVPWPTLTREPVQIAATPAPADSVMACDGGLLAVGRELDQTGRLVTAAPQSVTGGVAAGSEPIVQTLRTTVDDGLSAPQVLTAEPENRTRTDVAASGSATVIAEDLRGFAASACRPPLMESWLVGGSAATGAADLVLLANPGLVAATVQLTVFGAGEPQTPAGGTDLVVAPGSQIVVPLAGLVLGEESPVVRVSAVGAPVHAALQTSITRTLVPGGVDQVGAIALPEAQQIIPGVSVTDAPGVVGSSETTTLARILAPASDGTATVTVTTVGAAEPITTTSVPLAAGKPTEVELTGLPIGTYTVQVDSDAAVVAAVWQATGFDEGADFAWYTSAPSVDVASLFAAPTGPAPVLNLVNPTGQPISVVVAATDGGRSDPVTVEAHSSASLRLASGTVYSLDPESPGIRAALSLTGDGALAGFPVWSADAVAAEIIVYP